MSRLGETSIHLRAVAVLRLALVETFAKRPHDALRILSDSAALFEVLPDNVIKGKFHQLFGVVLDKLASGEQRNDYIDRGLIEYAAASFYFAQAGVSRYQACVENNLGLLFGTIGKFAEAHDHVDRAQALFTSLKDKVHLAQVDETRARLMLAQGRVAEAEKIVQAAVRTLEKGGEQSLLAEALTTQGIALARLHHHQQAHSALVRAVIIGEQIGDLESAGLAALAVVEHLGQRLSGDDLCATIQRAQELLKNSQDMAAIKRLAPCACRALLLVRAHPDFPASVDWANFSFNDAVHRYEAHLIRLALKDSGAAVTRAARLLGFKHHQSLISLLNGRHKDLRGSTRIMPRKRSIIPSRNTTGPKQRVSKRARLVRILHVEDNQVVADAVRETLELEGWEVKTCLDGAVALKKILSHAQYDLLLVDYDLPGVSGIELVRRARAAAHRQNTPIIVLSAALGEAEAREAGANKFLHKPEDIRKLVETIRGLLSSAED